MSDGEDEFDAGEVEEEDETRPLIGFEAAYLERATRDLDDMEREEDEAAAEDA